VGSTPTARTTHRQSEANMSHGSDEPFGDAENEAIDELNELSELLLNRIVDFAEEENIAQEMLSPMLMRLSVTLRMMDYMTSVAKPSGSGLKCDLERFQREVDDTIRDMKKDADRIVAESKQAMTEAGEDET
jgi:hypothetical protein